MAELRAPAVRFPRSKREKAHVAIWPRGCSSASTRPRRGRHAPSGHSKQIRAETRSARRRGRLWRDCRLRILRRALDRRRRRARADQCACLDVGARPRARRRAHDCVGANARPLLAARDGLASLAAAVAPTRESRFKALRRGPLLGARAASPASPCSSRPRDEPYVAAVAWAGLRSGSRSRAHVASGPRVPRASTAWGH